MISRRNIRVKVMQLLYAMETGNENSEKTDPVKKLKQELNQSCELFNYLLYFITGVARYAESDARQRASRNFTTAADLNVNVKIAGNDVLKKIMENTSFQKSESCPVKFEDTTAIVKKIYNNMVASEVYNQYVGQEGRNKDSEKEIIKFIFTDMMLPDENFTSHIEDHFTNWDDDSEMMNQLMMNFLQKPGSFNLDNLMGDEKWQFAKNLLLSVLEKKTYLTDCIKPKLKNWDSDRIAVIDMILMQMGVCEFLFFETIPPKVTINEYIDIAKEYSTPQSGHFVNGILDSIHKELISENKIHKIDFKQKK